MGISGSDVTKDTADIILLNDDFSSIIDGVEEGRRIFENFKKTIMYTMISNVAEFLPFFAYIILRCPLPLSAIFMLCIDVGTDIWPSLSLAKERAEADVLVRLPRKKTDRLVTGKLVFHIYALQGLMETAGGFLGYWACMHYYGFDYSGMIGMAQLTGFEYPKEKDIYNPLLPNLGNTNLGTGLEENYDCSKYSDK